MVCKFCTGTQRKQVKGVYFIYFLNLYGHPTHIQVTERSRGKQRGATNPNPTLGRCQYFTYCPLVKKKNRRHWGGGFKDKPGFVKVKAVLYTG